MDSNMRKINGILRVHQKNSRYFTDNSGKAIYLTGSHTWENFQSILLDGKSEFNYEEYLDFMVKHNHNFMRLWTWEQAQGAPWTEDIITFDPMPYLRSGQGTALDQKPRFDLDTWNEAYFERLRNRVIDAGKRGIYVSIKFFEGWSIKKKWLEPDPWPGHPYNRENNINGVDGDPDNDGTADIHTLKCPAVLERQKAFIRKTIDTVNDLDNVLYEVINEIECSKENRAWHYHMIDFIHEYESNKPKQHPVGMTAEGAEQDINDLLESNAEWISPGQGKKDEYRENPPPADGKKVIITDTDHLWGHGGSCPWVWKSFLRGLNPIFMDPWCPIPGETVNEGYAYKELNSRDYPDWEPIRLNMGYTLRFAERMDLINTIPSPESASSGYCLTDKEREYLVYIQEGGKVRVVLSEANCDLAVEWFDPSTGETIYASNVYGGRIEEFTSPFGDKAAIVYIQRICGK